MGKVYLVGAGCGSLDLYTVKAMKCIQEADCLVYDNLVDKRILEYCMSDCEIIYAGKKANQHTLKQEEICQLLVEKAKTKEKVVRLKGGDVYVFGRGGEEGQILFENNVPFEVVPGLSSVTAGLAYAGIPITHRGLSGGFQVYTGQLRENEPRQFDFSLMLDDYCTYVFLMSMAKLKMIVEGFLEAGKNPATPIAIVSKASMPSQKTLVGTLATILDDFKNAPLENPGIIVVGAVVQMKKYLDFYENKPLYQKKCLVTVVGKDHYLSKQLLDLGADVTEVQTGVIEYLDCPIPSLNGYLIFTSKHGVIGFMQNFLQQYHDLRKLSNVKIICIGKKTNEILQGYGLNADFMPSVACSEQLNDELNNFVQDGKIYLVKGDFVSNVNHYDEELVVYRNQEMVIDDKCQQYDYGFFTCASSVERFAKQNASKCDTYISIGSYTTKAIQKCYGEVLIKETGKALKSEMIKQVWED